MYNSRSYLYGQIHFMAKRHLQTQINSNAGFKKLSAVLLLSLFVNLFGVYLPAQAADIKTSPACHQNQQHKPSADCCDKMSIDAPQCIDCQHCQHCSGVCLLPQASLKLNLKNHSNIVHSSIHFYQYQDSPPIRPPV